MEEIIKQEEKTVCCRSYLSTKGRCFDCVEQRDVDPDEEIL